LKAVNRKNLGLDYPEQGENPEKNRRDEKNSLAYQPMDRRVGQIPTAKGENISLWKRRHRFANARVGAGVLLQD